MPKYVPGYFNSPEEFDTYIASPDYMKSNSAKGVCFGIQMTRNNTNDYAFDLHYPDKRIGVSKYSYAQGVPN